MTARFSPDARKRALETRAANRAGTPRTTRPGSETTTLAVGDAVRINRAEASTGVWGRYDGREGWVAAISAQTFPDDAGTYVEIGVTWTRPTPRRNPGTDTWFRADEVVPR